MLFRPLEIPEVVLIELEKKQDERGFFSRMFCSDMFVERGLCADYPQWNVSFNDHIEIGRASCRERVLPTV